MSRPFARLRGRSRRRWLASLLAAAALIASLAACSASDPPRGGPQLPSTPSFLSGGSSSGSPSPSGGVLPAQVPLLPFGGLPADGGTLAAGAGTGL